MRKTMMLITFLFCCIGLVGCVSDEEPEGVEIDGAADIIGSAIDINIDNYGRVDESTPVLAFEPNANGGMEASITDTVADASSEPVVLAFTIYAEGGYQLSVQAEVSAGEPHIFLRNAPGGEVVATGHGEGSNATEATFAPEGEVGMSYQVVLYISGATNVTYTVTVQDTNSCNEDDPLEPNDSFDAPYMSNGGLITARICNSSATELNPDYYAVPVKANETVEVAMVHVVDWGVLGLDIDDSQSGMLSPANELGIQWYEAGIRQDGTFVVGVTGEDIWNIYQLSICVDDRLEQMGHSGSNDTPDQAVVLEPGRYTELALCSFELWNPKEFGTKVYEQWDYDYYQVEVPAYRALRVTINEIRGGYIRVEGPEGMIYLDDDVYEFVTTSEAQTVTFGVTTIGTLANQFSAEDHEDDHYARYDIEISFL